jgi:hypothetical protein
MSIVRRNCLWGVLLLAVLASICASAAPMTCQATSAPKVLRTEGLTEPLGDLIVYCTGGTPTAANAVVPSTNIILFLNTDITSMATGETITTQWDEALLLVDEPNTLSNKPLHPLLNCGHDGAPDNNAASGAGVCEIISDGNPADTYNGGQNLHGTGVCGNVAGVVGPVPANTYGCGRPNAFQGRFSTAGPGPMQFNVITFAGVPVDPPGPGLVRVFRITNLRANAVLLGGGSVTAAVVAEGGTAPMMIANPFETLGVISPGLSATVVGSTIQITEGFTNAWRDQNIAFTVGNPNSTPSFSTAGNATYSAPNWVFNSPATTNYPEQAAQNVPGVFYNTEDMFSWQNNGANAPPATNPPLGFGIGPIANPDSPLKSQGFITFTGINQAGVSSQGTRIALSFSGVPANTSPVCQSKVSVHRPGTVTETGVMVMTQTDANGAGAFNAVNTPFGSSHTNLVVYEVLYADPFEIETASIVCRLINPSTGTSVAGTVTVKPSFAPFYSTPAAGHPTPTIADPAPAALPRFGQGTITLKLTTNLS